MPKETKCLTVLAQMTSDLEIFPILRMSGNVLQVAAYRVAPVIYLPCQRTRGSLAERSSTFEECQTFMPVRLSSDRTSISKLMTATTEVDCCL